MMFFQAKFVRKCFPKYLKTIKTQAFRKYFKLLIHMFFCAMNFEITCFKIGFESCVLKICDIYAK